MSNNKKRKDRGAQLEQDLLRLAAKNDLDETLASIRNLVEIQRVNVNCADENGKTPLILAVLNDHVPVARFMIEKKATVDAVDNGGRTALVHAILRHNPNVAMLRLLLESRRANVDQQFRYGVATFSPLGYAIVFRDVDVVALLLQFRANTKEMLYNGDTYPALHHACRYNSISTDIVRLLLDHEDGINLNTPVRDSFGDLMTPLCFACRSKKIEKVQLLVEKLGAPVFYDGVGRDTPCPLKDAVIGGSMEIIQFLLGKLPQGDNSAALSWPLKTALSLKKLEAAQLLLKNGANVNGQPYLYEYVVFRLGAENVVSFLLENGADVNMSMYGQTTLIAATKGGSVEVVKMLLKAGADVNMTNDFGETPLFAAAAFGNVELVKLFLNAQADVNICSNCRGTPLGVAHSNGHLDVVYLLLRASPHVWPRLQNVL